MTLHDLTEMLVVLGPHIPETHRTTYESQRPSETFCAFAIEAHFVNAGARPSSAGQHNTETEHTRTLHAMRAEMMVERVPRPGDMEKACGFGRHPKAIQRTTSSRAAATWYSPANARVAGASWWRGSVVAWPG